jgi:hypothetical protein
MRPASPIPELGRLTLVVKRKRENLAAAALLGRICREVGETLPAIRATAGGDASRLRGIPVLGARGIEGTLPGTQPEQALLAKQE